MFTKKEIIEANNCDLDSMNIALTIEFRCLCNKGMTGLAQNIYYELQDVKEEITNRILLGEWDEKYIIDNNINDECN